MLHGSGLGGGELVGGGRSGKGDLDGCRFAASTSSPNEATAGSGSGGGRLGWEAPYRWQRREGRIRHPLPFRTDTAASPPPPPPHPPSMRIFQRLRVRLANLRSMDPPPTGLGSTDPLASLVILLFDLFLWWIYWMDFEDCDKFVNGLWVSRGLGEFGYTVGGYFGICRISF